MAESFNCNVVTPEQQVIDDPVTYASIPAWDGQMGIAPGRAPLLVRLGIGAMRLDFESGKTSFYLVQGGFAQMLGENLTILCDSALSSDEITDATALEEYKEAMAASAIGDDEMKAKNEALQAAREKRRLARSAGSRN